LSEENHAQQDVVSMWKKPKSEGRCAKKKSWKIYDSQ